MPRGIKTNEIPFGDEILLRRVINVAEGNISRSAKPSISLARSANIALGYAEHIAKRGGMQLHSVSFYELVLIFCAGGAVADKSEAKRRLLAHLVF